MFAEPGATSLVLFYNVCGAGDKTTITFIMFAELGKAGGKITVTFIVCAEPVAK